MFLLLAVVALAVGCLYTVHPAGIPAVLLLIALTAFDLVIAFAPLALGGRPRWVWLIVTAGALLFLLGLATSLLPVSVGPYTLADLFYVAGYLCISAWVSAITYRVIGWRGTAQAVLASGAAATGVSLALWVATNVLAPASVPVMLRAQLYPVLATLFVALSLILSLRLGENFPAWRFVLAGLVVQLGIDSAAMVYALLGQGPTPPDLRALYLLSYLAIGYGATHPSILRLTTMPRRPRGRPLNRLHSGLTAIAIVPAVVVMGLPHNGPADQLMRAMLLAILLALLFSNLAAAMNDLARTEADSTYRAAHDALTGLPNRTSFFKEVSERLQDAEDTYTALFFLDCDNFKEVNDTWGHQAGDELLQQVAGGLAARTGQRDVLARHGGDEFVVATSLSNLDDVERKAARLSSLFDTPFHGTDGQEHDLTPSMGIAIAEPGDGQTVGDLLRKADIALYEAKARGRAQNVVFDAELDEKTRTRAAMTDALRRAIRDGELTVEFQPLRTGSDFQHLIGWEALARWHHPELGPISPGVFIPLAEEEGLIYELGELVLRRALLDLARLRSALGRDDVIVSVNVSPPQFSRPGFADLVSDALAVADVPGECLWLEITESLLVDKGPRELAMLEQVRESGVRIAIDDYGTGYASLATLQLLPIDIVKIDISLVSEIEVDDDALAQLSALITLLRTHRVEDILAEGVETTGQAAALMAVGCPIAQGWLFGRPTPPDTILAAAD